MLQPFLYLYSFLTAPRDEERGATATEYALIVAGIALVVLAGVTAFGGALNTWWNTLSTRIIP